MNLKKNGKVFTSKFVGTGHPSYKKNNLPGRGLTKVEKHCPNGSDVPCNSCAVKKVTNLK
jgi:hypothetical protein